MRFDSLLTQLTGTLSGVRAKAHVTEIARYHRIQASPGYDDAVDYVQVALHQIGIDASVSSFPADGRTETYGWTAPIGWRIRSGCLRELEPKERTLCSYAEVPISILGQSAAGNVEGEMIHIGKGTTPESVDGLDLGGQQGAGPSHGDLVAQLGQGPDVGPGHPAVRDVAHDHQLEVVEPGELFPDREHVEQGLGGMGVGAVAGVDHGGGHHLGDHVRRAR